MPLTRPAQRALHVSFAVLVVALLLVNFPNRPFLTNDLQTFVASLGILGLAAILLLGAGATPRLRHVRRLALRREGWLLLFAFLLACSWAAARHPPASFRPLVGWSQGILLFLFFPLVCQTAEARARLLRGATAAGAAVAAIAVARALAGNAAPLPVLQPFALAPSYLAQILLLPLFASVAALADTRRRDARAAAGAALVVIATALVLTRARAAWLGVLAGAVVAWHEGHGARRDRVTAMLVAGGVGAALVAATLIAWRDTLPTALDTLATLHDPLAGSAGGRLERWRAALPMIRDHWALGVGPGNWLAVFPLYRHRLGADVAGLPLPYGSWIELAGECGLPAAVAFLAFAAGLALPAAGRPSDGAGRAVRGALVAAVVAAAFHESLVVRVALLNLWLILALAGAMDAGPGRGRAVVLDRRGIVAAAATACLVLAAGALVEERHLRAGLAHGMLARTRVADDGLHLDLPVPFRAAAPLLRRYLGALDHRRDPAALAALARHDTGRASGLATIVARAEIARGACAEAAYWIDLARAIHPFHAEPHLLRCACALGAGRADAALAACEEGLAVDGRDPWLRLRRAEALAALARRRAALAGYAAAAASFRARLERSFGQRAVPESERLVAGLRAAATAARDLRTPDDGAALRRTIATTPLLHKGLAVAGDTLYFATNVTGRFALWSLDARAEEEAPPRLVTNDGRAPFRPRAHPDAPLVYFAADRDGDQRYALHVHDRRSGATRRLGRGAGVEGEYELAPDGRLLVVKRERGRRHDLHLRATATGATRALTADGHPKRDAAWDRDGTRVAYVEREAVLAVAAVAGGAPRALAHHPGARLHTPAFSPDGARIAYVVEAAADAAGLWIADAATGAARPVAGLADARTPLWLDDRRLVVRERRADEHLLRLVDVDAETVRAIGPAAGVVYPPVLAADRAALFYVLADATTPAAIERLALADGTRRTLLRLDALASGEAVLPERWTIDGGAGPRRAYVYLPPAAAAAPAVIWLHGGSDAFSPRWHPYAQYLAHAGFVFAALNYTEARPDGSAAAAVAEVQLLRARLAALPAVDGARVALVGVSSGTRVLQRALRQAPRTFAGAVEYAPIPDPIWATPAPDLPPLLVFLAENDPFLDGTDRLRALARQRDAGTRVEHVLLAGEGHDLRRVESIAARLEATRAFLERLPPASP